MSHGKETARDIVYGRRGGRWDTTNPEPRTIEQIKADTLAAGGTWPGEPETDDDMQVLSLFDIEEDRL